MKLDLKDLDSAEDLLKRNGSLGLLITELDVLGRLLLLVRFGEVVNIPGSWMHCLLLLNFAGSLGALILEAVDLDRLLDRVVRYIDVQFLLADGPPVLWLLAGRPPLLLVVGGQPTDLLQLLLHDLQDARVQHQRLKLIQVRLGVLVTTDPLAYLLHLRKLHCDFLT